MDMVILAKDFDMKNVRLGSLKTLDNGGKVVYINYKNHPLIIQTPKLKAPFGLSNWENKYSLDLSLNGYEGSQESTAMFYKALNGLDEFMLEQGLQNGMAWFKKKMASKEVVDALYTRNVKFSKDRATGEITDKYPPTFKLPVPNRDGKFQVDVYDANRNNIDLASVDLKGAKVTAIAQCLGLWLAGGKFGCSWKIIQLKVEPQETISGYAFKDVEDAAGKQESDIDDDDVLDSEKTATSGQINVDTSEEEEEEVIAVEEDDELETVAVKASPEKKPSGRGRKAAAK